MPSISLGPFSFNRELLSLQREGRPVGVSRPGAALLAAMLDANGAVLGKNALMEAGWPGTIVEEANLTVQIAALRKALGRTEDGGEWIITVPRVGYRLVRSTAEPASGRPVIAVMPFVNLSSDAEQGFFADGLTDDLTTALSRFKTFAVVGRNSTVAYSGPGADVRETAAALAVRYVLQGSVRRAGARARVSAQLIEGETGTHLWGDRFEGEGEDIFDFQDSITESVIGVVEPRILKAEIERARHKRPERFDVWDLYVQALPLVHSGAVANWSRALELLDHAVTLDPAYAPALTLAAWAHSKRNHLGGPSLPNYQTDVEAALELGARAVAADPDEALALALHGWLHIHHKRDFSKLDLVLRAVALNPNNISVLDLAAVAHLRVGEFDEAMFLSTRALELSPGALQRWVFMMHIAGVHNAVGRYGQAIDVAKRAVELEPNHPNAHLALAIAYAQLGQIEAARQEVATAVRMRPDVTIAALMVDRMRYPERVANWVEGLRKAGLPD